MMVETTPTRPVPAARNPAYIADGRIDCEIEHPELGWIPYTCAPDTGEGEMQAIWDGLQSRDDIAPYVAPSVDAELEEWRTQAKVTRRAFCMALYGAGILTKGSAIQAAKGDWPAAMQGALDGMTEAQATDAEVAWAAVAEVHRNDPLIGIMQQFLGMTDTQVDGLFGGPA